MQLVQIVKFQKITQEMQNCHFGILHFAFNGSRARGGEEGERETMQDELMQLVQIVKLKKITKEMQKYEKCKTHCKNEHLAEGISQTTISLKCRT